MIMRKLVFILTIFMIGCAGSPDPHHPWGGCGSDCSHRDGRATEQPWWSTPYTAKAPRESNPWLNHVHAQPNKFDPWANDDIQRYSVGPMFPSVFEYRVYGCFGDEGPRIVAPRMYYLRLRAKKQVAEQKLLKKWNKEKNDSSHRSQSETH